MSILGFDRAWDAKAAVPSLTIVAQPHHLNAKRAAGAILDDNLPAVRESLPLFHVVRGSTGLCCKAACPVLPRGVNMESVPLV